MTCNEIRGYLPWLLNGTLDSATRDEVAAHLAHCDGCREDLETTSTMGEAALRHPRSEVLVAFALGEPTEPIDLRVVTDHLEHCASCRAELDLVKESYRLAPGASRGVLPPVIPWRQLALAAGLTSVVLGGGWLWTWFELSAERSVLHDRVSKRPALEDARSASAEGRAGSIDVPEINLPIVELFSIDEVLRGEPEAEIQTVAAAGSEMVALLLVTDDVAAYDAYRLELRDGEGREIWQSDGLRRQAGGDFSLILPSELLGPEPLTLELSGKRGEEWQPIGTYRVRGADRDGG